MTPQLHGAACRVGDLFPTPHHWANELTHQNNAGVDGYDGWCYTPRQEARTFSEAEHVCRAWGGHVFSYQSQQEKDMAVRPLPRGTRNALRTGGSTVRLTRHNFVRGRRCGCSGTRTSG